MVNQQIHNIGKARRISASHLLYTLFKIRDDESVCGPTSLPLLLISGQLVKYEFQD